MHLFFPTKMLIFIDTETTGLPKKRQNALVEPNIWPDLVSIAWIVTTNDCTVSSFYTIVRPNGWIIPEDSIAIHKITNEIASYGMTLENVVKNLLHYLVQPNCRVVAHNVNFDTNVILNALKWRLNMTIDSRLFENTFCTMEAGKRVISSGRFPTLNFLYQHLFGKPPDVELHNAMNDALLCMKIYFKLNNLPPKRPLIVENVVSSTLPSTLSLSLADAEE